MMIAMVALPLALYAQALWAALPLDIEYEGTRHVLQEFMRAGKPAPAGSPQLAKAARLLADDALSGAASDGIDSLAVAEALSDSEAWDVDPRAFVLRGSPPSEVLNSFLSRQNLNELAASHLGLGVVLKEDRASIALVLVQRRALLDPFPRTLPQVGKQSLCGELLAGLDRPEVYLTGPSGSVQRIAVEQSKRGRFCALLPLLVRGRHTVEVIGHGEQGPKVAALFFVDCGPAKKGERRSRVLEPTTVAGARKALLERIKTLRQAHGIPALLENELLSRIAQSYSEEMAGKDFFAHVAPEGADLKARLKNAGYAYDAAGENIGFASGPLAAHFGIEQSPAHRAHLLDSTYTRVGLGIAFRRVGGRDQAFITEVFARPSQETRVTFSAMQSPQPYLTSPSLINAFEPPVEPRNALYRLISRSRSERKLSDLRREPVLERIALELARRSLSDGARPPDLAGYDLAFAEAHGLRAIAVDSFLAQGLESLPDSSALADAGHDAVGIGAVAAKSGAAPYQVVIVYAASR